MLKKGFTLIELMIVLTVLALLTALAIAFYPNVMEKMKIAKISKIVKDASEGFQRYKQDTGYNPTDFSSFMFKDSACNTGKKSNPAGWDGPYLTSYSGQITQTTKDKFTGAANADETNLCSTDPSNGNFADGGNLLLDEQSGLMGSIVKMKVDNIGYYGLAIWDASDATPETSSVLAEPNNKNMTREGDVSEAIDSAPTASTSAIRLLHGVEIGIDGSPKAGSNPSIDTINPAYTTGKVITAGILRNATGQTNGKGGDNGNTCNKQEADCYLSPDAQAAMAFVPLEKY